MSERVWVITGTNSGLGLAMALHILKQGDKVIASVRSPTKFNKDLKEAGAHPLVLDLNAPDEEIKQCAEKAIQIYGRVDVLVNNAGTMDGGYGPVEELGLPDIRMQFQANLFATIAFSQPFIAHMRERRSGTILNISSCSAVNCPPSWGAYSAAKAALDAFTDALHRELLLFGVRVFSILPGYFPTNVWRANPFWTDNSKDERQNASRVYTDLETQGFDTMNMIPRLSTAGGQIGDSAYLAKRVWEVVSGTGLAAEVMGPEYHPRWFRIPLGSDSGSLLTAKAKYMTDNIAAYKKLWQSTDVEPERVEKFLEQYQ